MARPDCEDRFQFRLAHLLVLMTLVAVVMGIAVRLVEPAMFSAVVSGAPKLFLLFVATYAMLFGGWLLLRGPNFWAQWKRLHRRRAEIIRRQGELESAASNRRSTTSTSAQPSGSEEPRRLSPSESPIPPANRPD